MLKEIELLAEQFAAAGKEFPNLEHWWISWPNGVEPDQDRLAELLVENYPVPFMGRPPDRLLNRPVFPLLGGVSQWGNNVAQFRWEYLRPFRQGGSIPDEDEGFRCGQRFRQLASAAVDAVYGREEQIMFLPDAACGCPAELKWAVVVHEVLQTPAEPLAAFPDCGIRKLPDLFTDSARALLRLFSSAVPVDSRQDWFLFCRISPAEQLICGLATEPRWLAFASVSDLNRTDVDAVLAAMAQDSCATENGAADQSAGSIVYPAYEFKAVRTVDVQADRGAYLLAMKDCQDLQDNRELQDSLQKTLAVLSIDSRPAPAVTVFEADPDRTGPNVSPTADRRTTQPGDAERKLIGALTKHHKYEDGSCLNTDPIGGRELARKAGINGSTTHFFTKYFEGGHAGYVRVCQDAHSLAYSLKMLNGELRPRDVFGRQRADDIEQPDE